MIVYIYITHIYIYIFGTWSESHTKGVHSCSILFGEVQPLWMVARVSGLWSMAIKKNKYGVDMGIYNEQILLSDVLFFGSYYFRLFMKNSVSPEIMLVCWRLGVKKPTMGIQATGKGRGPSNKSSRVEVPGNGWATAPEAVCIFEQLERQLGIPAGNEVMKMKKNIYDEQ